MLAKGYYMLHYTTTKWFKISKIILRIKSLKTENINKNKQALKLLIIPWKEVEFLQQANFIRILFRKMFHEPWKILTTKILNIFHSITNSHHD